MIFKTLGFFEIIHLSVEMTNINIWVPLSFSHKFVYFSQMIFRVTLQNLDKIESCVLGAKDININIWVTFKIAQNVFTLPKMLCK
jgi:hypothetical protein